jgi:hypothetical protein
MGDYVIFSRQSSYPTTTRASRGKRNIERFAVVPDLSANMKSVRLMRRP